MSTVECYVESHVATLTLNRQNSLNAFNAEMRLELHSQLKDCIADSSVRVIVLTGAGRAFCAGADLAETFPEGQTVEQRLIREYKPILMSIVEAPKPVVAMVNGVTAGIGCAFVQACDLAVMSDRASLYHAFAAVGLIPDGGSTWHLVRRIGSKLAYEMLVLGERVSAEKCLELGLVNRVVDATRLTDEVTALAARLVSTAPLSLWYTKEALHAAQDSTLSEAISTEARFQLITNQSEDHAEGKKAFFEKRTPRWVGY